MTNSIFLRTLVVAGLAIFVSCLFVIVVRTAMLRPLPLDSQPCSQNETDFIRVTDVVLSRFQTALQLQTISLGLHDYNREQLGRLVEHIIKSFPVVHSSTLVKWQVVANFSLLYVVQGSNDHLLPYLLMAHLDVVPVNNESLWEVPPFTGQVHNGYIYGRGTIDDKHSVFGILEALETKLKKNWKPMRTLYIAFGHDEEVNGLDGAGAISQLLKQQGMKFEFIMDEGSMVVQDVVPGIDQPIALISTSEKGFVNIKLSVTMPAGHSSMPCRESSIGILARALSRLEDQPHASQFGTGPEIALAQHIAPHLSFPARLVLANLWLFSPVVSRLLSLEPATSALIRTTTAITRFKGGIKDNVISPIAEAIVNHRIHPSQTVAEVIKHDKEIISDDRVKFDVITSLEAHPVSDHNTFGFQMIAKTVRQIWGYRNVIVAPSLLIANTDTTHYLEFSPYVYRFNPTFMSKDDLRRFHGDNERIAVNDYERTINFYQHLMANADGSDALAGVSHQTHSADL